MDLQHRFSVPAPIDTTWAAFNDLERITPCFPGASLTSVDGDDFTGTVKIKLGPISMQYSGAGRFLERDEATHRARFEATGKDKRGNGTAAAKVVAQLTAQGDETLVEVDTTLTVTGKPAQFGRGLMQDVSNKLLGRFTDCLAGELGGKAEEAAPAPEPASVQSAPVPESTPAPAPAAAVSSAAEPVPADDEGLDLFRTVAPVLVRRYALPVGGGLLLLYLMIRLVRNR